MKTVRHKDGIILVNGMELKVPKPICGRIALFSLAIPVVFIVALVSFVWL